MILVIAAHPDDEVLGCGGTIARSSTQGDVHVLILGEGMTSRSSSREKADQSELRQLRASAESAAKILGVASLNMENLPDNRFDEVPLLDIVKIVEKAIAQIRPEVIYTHHPGDLNVDHRLTFQATLTAARPLPGSHVVEIYSFEVPSSTEWAFHRFEPMFRPNVFVDISRTLDTKIKALQQYENEMREFPHPRSSKALQAIASRWGSLAGLQAAEAFELIRSTRR